MNSKQLTQALFRAKIDEIEKLRAENAALLATIEKLTDERSEREGRVERETARWCAEIADTAAKFPETITANTGRAIAQEIRETYGV